MNQPRRILVCVAMGAVLALSATVVTRLLVSDLEGGWFMYSPNTEPIFSSARSDGETFRGALVWLVAIALWFAFSWRLFRTRDE